MAKATSTAMRSERGSGPETSMGSDRVRSMEMATRMAMETEKPSLMDSASATRSVTAMPKADLMEGASAMDRGSVDPRSSPEDRAA